MIQDLEKYCSSSLFLNYTIYILGFVVFSSFYIEVFPLFLPVGVFFSIDVESFQERVFPLFLSSFLRCWVAELGGKGGGRKALSSPFFSSWELFLPIPSFFLLVSFSSLSPLFRSSRYLFYTESFFFYSFFVFWLFSPLIKV